METMTNVVINISRGWEGNKVDETGQLIAFHPRFVSPSSRNQSPSINLAREEEEERLGTREI